MVSQRSKSLTPARVSAPQCLKTGFGLRQREHGEHATELGELAQLLVPAHGPETVGVLLETRGETDAGPAADAREHADVLLALELPSVHVADDAGRRLELVQLFGDVVRVDALQVALERPIAGDAARGDERAAPHRELLGLRLDDLARPGIPHDEVAHAAGADRKSVCTERACDPG